ncbi:MAG: hypothetical protein ACE5HL_02655 [Terriglobia bacterium]
MRRRSKILLVVVAAVVGLGGLLAWRIHTWGRPVPLAYRRLALASAGAENRRSYTYVRLGPAGEPLGDSSGRTVALDADDDGTIDFVLSEGSPPTRFSRPRPDDPEARWLVVCLDGIPYKVLLSLWEEGYFREFFHPAPLISPFPSDSETALTDVFHTGPVPGYQHRYFDRATNQLAGGPLTTLGEENLPYLRRLDYDMGGLFKALAYVLPRKSYRADLGRLRQRFLASRRRVYLAHIASSDSLYHILPRKEMRRLLLEVDSLLRELYFNAQGKLRITVFSDHGNSLVASRAVPLTEHLAAHGWRLTASRRRPRDVVVPAYGLVGFLAVYCAPEQRTELARRLAQMEGADLVVYSDSSHLVIENARGQARLDWNQDASAFRYQPLTADPLALADILAGLRQEGKIDPEGWAQDADLFRATLHHAYPDPAYRLWQWATNHVRNPADLLVSLRPGYFHGSRSFQAMVEILSTHGALDHAQSTGFAMTTDSPLPGPLRSRDLLPEDLRESKAAVGANRNSKIKNRNAKAETE